MKFRYGQGGSAGADQAKVVFGDANVRLDRGAVELGRVHGTVNFHQAVGEDRHSVHSRTARAEDKKGCRYDFTKVYRMKHFFVPNVWRRLLESTDARLNLRFGLFKVLKQTFDPDCWTDVISHPEVDSPGRTDLGSLRWQT